MNAPFVSMASRAKRSRLPLVAFLAATALVWAVSGYIGSSTTRLIAQQRVDERLTALGALRADLEGRLNATLASADGVVSHVALQPGIDQAEFSLLAEAVLRRHPHMRHLALARDNRVSHIHPLEPNRKVLGQDFSLHPSQGEGVRRMLVSGKPLLVGPEELVQGGKALIYRAPVYLNLNPDNGYWGMLAAVVDIDALLDTVGLDRDSRTIALRTLSESGDPKTRLRGPESVFDSKPLSLDIRIAGAHWQLASLPPAQPAGSDLFWWSIGLLIAIPIGLLAGHATASGLGFKDSSERLNGLMAAMPDVAFILDRDGRYVAAFGGRDSSRYSATDALVGQRLHDVLPAEAADFFLGEVRKTLDDGILRHVEYPLGREDLSPEAKGGPAGQQWFEGRLVSLGESVAGEPAVLWVAYNITDRKRMEEEMRLGAQVFESSREGIIITDAANRIVSVNSAFLRTSGFTEDQLIGQTPALWQSGRQNKAYYEEMWKSIQQAGHWHGELWNRRANGGIYPQSVSISVVRNDKGEVTHHIAIMSDISERKAAEDEIRRLALHDVLTGLANRTLLSLRMDQSLAEARRDGKHPAVLFLDLDDFKPINDSMGHDAGDQVLREVGRRLSLAVRETDTVARMGGDEFVILLTGPMNLEKAEAVAEKVLHRLAEPIDVLGRTWTIGASIGIGLYPQHGQDADALLRAADDAMYLAKARGKNTYTTFPGEPAPDAGEGDEISA